jgi:hypothetical protein
MLVSIAGSAATILLASRLGIVAWMGWFVFDYCNSHFAVAPDYASNDRAAVMCSHGQYDHADAC